MIRIGLLLCDHVADRFRGIAGDYPEMFGNLLEGFAPEIDIVSIDIVSDKWPESINEYDAFLTTGSRYSVYDEAPWLETFRNFIREVRESGKPFVGICFGHQMMAEALGGRVAKSDYGWGVGIHSIDILQKEEWMSPFQQEIRLQYMHQDQIQQLPPGAVLLGSSDHCPVGMFRIGETMLGIQAHPEFDRGYVSALLDDRIEKIGRPRTVEGQSSLGQAADTGLVAGWIMRFFEMNLNS